MATEDRERWDRRYVEAGAPMTVGPPHAFEPQAALLAAAESGLEIACGAGAASVWLAQQGVRVLGCDVSAVAIEQADALADQHGVSERCRFEVCDLDDGLPVGPPVDLILCNRFRDPELYPAMVARLVPGGLLAIAVLSEVGAGPGQFRAEAGELTDVFAELDEIAAGEGDGLAWLLARKP